jgi:general secretion pathway protein K
LSPFLRQGMPPRRRRGDRRGIALIMVITTVMFLTVLVTDISFGARVRFLTAEHERDETKAYWLAQTGVNLYRLVLTANKQMGSNSMIQSLGMGDSLWQMLPFINTGLLRMFVTSDGSVDDDDVQDFEQTGEVSDQVRQESREQKSTRFGNRNFLDFDGDFLAEVHGEECGINVNALASRSSDVRPEDTATGQQILGLMSGEENDQWLRDRNLEKLDLIDNLADWVDPDTMVASGKGGYEDDFYNGLSSPYLSKNARFDTKQEIRLVEGWQDEVYDRWGSQLTIYGNGKVNITCADDTVIGGLIRSGVTPRPSDDEISRLLSQMHDYMATASFKSGKDFADWLQTTAGVEVSSTFAQQISTTTKVFTIKSTGQVGDASAKITAVVDYTSSNEGTVLYWRVD